MVISKFIQTFRSPIWTIFRTSRYTNIITEVIFRKKNFITVWSWKLGRQRSLSNDDNESIDNVINTVNVLNNRFYQEVDNTDSSCFYFPEPNNEPVVFRGQCDFSIPTVTNFDAARVSIFKSTSVTFRI